MKVNLDESDYVVNDETDQDKLSDAISRLEDSVSVIEEISSIDVIDTSPSEVEYQLQDMDHELSNIRMVIDTLEEIQDNINGETNGESNKK